MNILSSSFEHLRIITQGGSSKNFLSKVPSLKIVYAFAGHDAQNNKAAYHHQMKAVSIGGRLSYSENLRPWQKKSLLQLWRTKWGIRHFLIW